MNFKDDENLHFLIENAPIGIAILDAASLKVEMLNEKFLEIAGKPKEAILGKWYWEPFAEARSYYQDALDSVVLTGEAYFADEVELMMVRHGREEWIFVTFIYAPVKDAAGQITKIAVWVLENTQQVKSQQAFKQTNEELTAANEEIISANEELAVINEELAASNEELAVTNEELTITQQALQQAYELSDRQKRVYETVTSATPDLMYVFDLDYRFTYANTALLTMWGKSYENAVGKSLLENGYEPWHAEMHEREIDIIKTTKQPIRGDVSFPHATLGKRFYDYIFTPVLNEQGDVEAVAGTTRDVTERTLWEESLAHASEDLQSINEELATANEEQAASNKELTSTNEQLAYVNDQLTDARHKIEEREASLRLAIDAANFGTWYIHPVTREFITDARLKELFGYQADEDLSIEQAVAQITDEYRGYVATKLENAIYNNGDYDVTYPVVGLHDNRLRWLRAIGNLVADLSGAFSAFTGVVMDITEQIQAKISLESAYEQLRLSREAAQLGFFDMDLTKGTLEWDTRCRELFGISHTGPVTYEKDFVTGLFPEDKERILAVINKAFNKSISKGVYDVEYRTVGAEDQQLRWVRAKGQAYFDQDDKPIRFIGSVIDITEQKQDEQRKSDFIGMVSHELKTPLTSLSAYIQMLQAKAVKAEDTFTSGALDQSLKQVKRMTTMINGFLNVSRLESSKITIDKQRFDMADLVRESEAETIPMHSSHQIIFAPVEKTIVIADMEKIGQVISNLISNAVKYSRAGSTVSIACINAGDTAVVSVKDEGIGIDKKEVGKLFERYYRVEGNTHVSGFGIGLYLCFEIIERHHGKIWVESEPGEGSTFFFSIPTQVFE